MNPVILSGNRDRLIIIVVENVDAIKMKTLLVIVDYPRYFRNLEKVIPTK
jgi:hypothetical protein